jgi:two-component system CheB/CheR fusion protein
MNPAFNQLFPLLLEQSREYAILLLDPECKVVWLNGCAEAIFGYRLADIVGKIPAFLFVPEDLAQGVFEHEIETATAQGSVDNDRWMMRADGSRFWANGATFSLRQTDGTLAGFGKMLRNRSALRQQMVTLRNEITALTELDAQKNKILAVASHELRNPIFATTVALEMIRRAVPSTPKLEQLADTIDRQIHAIRRVLDDITDATQVSTGKLKLKRERLDLREIITRALETMRSAIESRRHTVVEVLLPVPIPVEGDADRLQQVLVNLIDNAVKYTPPGGQIGIRATTEAKEAVFEINDNGIGIPADMHSHIFDLFTQVPNPDNVYEKGLGIGLSLVKNLVAQHGGTIQVRSNGPGKGSEFTMRLPLAASDAPETP